MKTETKPKPKVPKIPAAPETRAPALAVEAWPVDRPKPYAKNPRRNDAAVEKVAASIREFGWAQPIVVDGDGVIIIGHTRLKAAKKLGLKTVPVLVRADLAPEQVAALRLADNKTAELAEWDEPLLAAELDALVGAVDMEQFGFDLSAPELTEGQTDEDAVPEPPPEPVSRRGAVYALGRHRLMCGDSTSAEDFARLMGGERADIAFTSPPYNMGRKEGNWAKTKNVAMHHGHAYMNDRDEYSNDEYAELLAKALANALANADDAMFNIGILGGSKFGVIEMLSRFRDKFCDIIVWNKSQSMPSGLPSHAGMLSHRCELIFCFNDDGTRMFHHAQWSIGTEINRIDTVNASGNEYAKIHAATFPVALPEYVCGKYAERSVLDPFCGTGTTIVAAEKKGIRAFGMELDPHYCDVIRSRWAEFVHGEGCDWQALAPEVEE